MKKFIIFLGVYSLFLAVPIAAKDDKVNYKLYMDTQSENSLAMKEEVLNILAYLCKGVDEDSYATVVKDNLEAFEKIAKSRASWRNGTLIIKVGNAKGTYLKGTYKKEKLCLEEVKPKSKILELLGMD